MEKFERKYKIEDEELKRLLKKKESLVDEGKKLAEEYHAVEEKLKKKGLQLQKIKDKIIPLVTDRYKDMDLSEVEEVTMVELIKGEVVASISDVVEFYKFNYLEKKYAKPETKDGDSKDVDAGGEAKEKQPKQK